MNKRLKFFISIVLIFAVSVSAFCVPASSFENDVETSTSVMLLVNADTDTVCFSKNPDNKWYAGYLSELTTFLVAGDMIPMPDVFSVKIEKSYIDALPYSDGCLDPFIDQTLTAQDLMAIMLLTSGSDAAYALADLATDGDREAFVDAMNEKADDLGCTTTHYVSPGFDSTSDHHTTCRDLYHIYMEVVKSDFYNKLMDEDSYTPKSLQEEEDEQDKEDDEESEYTVVSEASILNAKSPYYFRYVNGAKYSYAKDTYAGIALTTTYRGKTYFFAGLLGMNENERNIYADAKKLTTWAYLNLSDRKMLNAEEELSGTMVKAGWGMYRVALHPFNSAYKTMPNEYDEAKLQYKFDVPKTVETPLLDGQTIGRAKMTYDGEEIDDVELVINSDEGLNMLSDFGRFGSYVYSRLMPYEPPVKKSEDDVKQEDNGATEETSAPDAEAETEAATEEKE